MCWPPPLASIPTRVSAEGWLLVLGQRSPQGIHEAPKGVAGAIPSQEENRSLRKAAIYQALAGPGLCAKAFT